MKRPLAMLLSIVLTLTLRLPPAVGRWRAGLLLLIRR